MGTGWRRAFCTTISRDPDSTISDKQQTSPSPSSPSPSPRSCTRLGFFSNPSTPRSFTPRLQQPQSQPVSSPSLRCRTISEAAQTATGGVNESPRLLCKTTPRGTKSPKTLLSSNPSSPRSPLKLSLFKNSFKFRSSCGICLNSVKTGQGTAIYTAECAHAFHFPCIAAHVRKHGSLVCPVCNATWKDVPLLAIHKNLGSDSEQKKQNDVVDTNIQKPNAQEKITPVENSPRAFKIKHVEQKYSDLTRSYDDDEPLLSPTSGGRFIPIPEADENLEEEQDDDVEEFQGFFVNPTPSSSIKTSFDDLQISGRDSRNVDVRLMPECAVVSVTRTHGTYALALRVKAPPPPQAARNSSSTTAPILGPSQRAPIDLVTVLDVSGSMTGPKLHMLKRAMRLVISSLGPADRLSIVAFSACPKRLLPLRRMTAQGQRAARRIIDRLVCCQGNSVGEALRRATKVLEDRRERNPVASIMLLSDGQDERVPSSKTNQRQCSSNVSSTRFAHIEIPVHAFGFGQNGGYTHEPAEDAFAKCVGGLLSVVVQDLRIQLGFLSGSAPAEICAVYSCSGRPTVLSSGSVRLGDLYAEEERELLLELKVPAYALGTHHVMAIRCVYKDPATQEVVQGREESLIIQPPPPQSVRSSGPRIERLRNLFITTRAIAESRRLVEHNDFTSAHHLLGSARALLMQSSSISTDEYVRGLEAELGELHWRRQHQIEQNQMMMIQRRKVNEREIAMVDDNGEPLTPTSAWRAAEKLAKVAMMKKSLNRISDLHGFENARF
ncbi:Zinc finger (C3HC4-type RING finger) family protein [Quillaja saponaria]|uniref:RING-type E3 ubiquitin transferase n=1 Tax=Quillaja saponaria TaxID=32244 RepID=A0AAD7PT31_QUISA|nr:Zinc finger (C3HC4-type RING finger) family protein [Quillaja saponaria]